MKNQFVKSLLLLMILFCTVAYNPPDGEVIRSIAFRLEKWSADYPQEKVYLHLARSYYAAGDSIWFKAYVTVGAQHQLSALSGVLQVELVNQQNRVRQSISLPVSDGITWGEFALPSNMPAGIYRLRAYTNWMRNFNNKYFYDETIIIGNAKKLQATASYSYNGQQISAVLSFMGINQVPQANRPVSYEVLINSDNITKGAGTTDATGKLNLTFTIQSKNDAPYERSGQIISKLITADKDTLVSQVVFNPIAAQADVQFFPEGGSLVTGISSVVGFKAVGPDGLGIEANGRILDNDNNTIVDFRTQHRGMGSFKLNPEHGKSYRALIDFPDGSHHTFGLPQAKSTGYVMSITWAGNDILNGTFLEEFDTKKRISLKGLLEKYQGQPLYVDFWANWCSACRIDIANSEEPKKYLKAKNVAYIYLSIDREKDRDKWRNASSTDKIIDNQYLLLSGTESKLAKVLKLREIPRYLIFDKQHNLKSFDAPRPTSSQLNNLRIVVANALTQTVKFN